MCRAAGKCARTDPLIAMLSLSRGERATLGQAARSRIQRQFSVEHSWRHDEETCAQTLVERPKTG